MPDAGSISVDYVFIVDHKLKNNRVKINSLLTS